MYQDGILVLDFGGAEARSIARRLRGERVFSQMLPYDAPLGEMTRYAPRGIILSGDGQDAFAEGAPDVESAVYELGLPIMGFGYGARILLRHMGGKLLATEANLGTVQVAFDEDAQLFSGLEQSERVIERLDEYELPEGFRVTATARDGRAVAYEDPERRAYGMQFYPESNDPDGLLILRNFACSVAGCEPNWTIDNFLLHAERQIRDTVGAGRAVIAISGGVDSAVCAALMHRAIGERLSCLHVDTGLMRIGERERVETYFDELGVNLTVVDARDRFLEKLQGVTENQIKHRVVYAEYERVLLEAVQNLGEFDFLTQGTIYNDEIDHVNPLGVAHMNGEGHAGRLLEPLRMLFKEEVRELGTALGLPHELVSRQTFPSAGLAVRCVGELTSDRLRMVREADRIFRDEIKEAGLDKRIGRYFAVLTSVMTGTEQPGYAVALRAVHPFSMGRASAYRLPYDLLERIVERITSEVRGVNRVVYDITGAPPATIEWD